MCYMGKFKIENQGVKLLILCTVPPWESNVLLLFPVFCKVKNTHGKAHMPDSSLDVREGWNKDIKLLP